jgi:hypothetical protein
MGRSRGGFVPKNSKKNLAPPCLVEPLMRVSIVFIMSFMVQGRPERIHYCFPEPIFLWILDE